jgi:hypothetical protein
MVVPTTQDGWLQLGKPLLITGSKSLDYALTLTQVNGLATAIPATALMVARPEVIFGITAASGSYATATGTTHHTTDTSAVTDKFLAQFGILSKLSSGTTQGYVAGYLSVIHRMCGTSIGSRSIEIEPNQTNGAPKYYLLGRVPASGADKLRAAIVGNAVNDIDYLFYVRGVNDPDNPGSWVAIGTWATFSNGAFGICTTDASVSGVTPANYHLLEFAVALRLKTAGANPAGFLRVSAGLSFT